MKGLSVDIYESKSIGNCSNEGISSRFKTLILVGDNIPEIFEGNDDNSNVIKIVKRDFGNRIYYHCEPINKIRNGLIGYMSGGCFVYTCDSRFPFDYAIPLHDRCETQQSYNSLCK